jgi:hypothetical protein
VGEATSRCVHSASFAHLRHLTRPSAPLTNDYRAPPVWRHTPRNVVSRSFLTITIGSLQTAATHRRRIGNLRPTETPSVAFGHPTVLIRSLTKQAG